MYCHYTCVHTMVKINKCVYMYIIIRERSKGSAKIKLKNLTRIYFMANENKTQKSQNISYKHNIIFVFTQNKKYNVCLHKIINIMKNICPFKFVYVS